MSELPELPALTPRVRPVPVGGIEAAVVSGRRRRNRAFGAAGGAVTAAIVVVAFALASPGARNESLLPAQQPPVVDRAPAASPSPAVPAGTAPTAPPSTASQPGVAPAPAGVTASADAHRPTATAAPPTAEREDYTEQPRDQAAPQACRQAPGGSTGPVIYGGATGCSSASTGPSSVKPGGRTFGTTDMCVPHGGQATVLRYAGGQEHEVVVTNADGELVYRFSDTVRFVQDAHRRTIGAGRCLVWTGTWDTTYTNGKPVPRGRYMVTVSLRMADIGGRKPEPGEASMSFSVDVY